MAAGTGKPRETPDQDGDSVASATRALVDATSALSRLLTRQVSAVSEEVGETIAAGLREAARGLADASAGVDQAANRAPRAARRRRERVDRTRAELLDAAERVFATQGFEGASVGDVAAAAGYTKGAVYSHFGSKSELFLVLARERVLCRVEAGDSAGSGGPRGLAAAIEGRLEATVDDPSTLLGIEVLAYAVRHPESRPELASLFSGTISDLASQIRDDRIAREPVQDPPTTATASEADYDNALGILAVTNVTAMLSTISTSPRLSVHAGARVVARLIGPHEPGTTPARD
ncbi:MAG: TetR/AcrR family transcriptional regulator [Rhodoglobus sp.]